MSLFDGDPSAPKYQLLDPLLPEEFAALKADIENRGVMVPIEKDEDGNTLDGHNREQIAAELGIECPTVIRRFATEEEKREHVLKLNLARRHLDPVRWGRAFAKLLEERGIRLGRGAVNQHTLASATVAEAAAELGVPERTARHRLEQARKFDALPAEAKEKVQSGTATLKEAVSEVRKADREESRKEAAKEAAKFLPPSESLNVFQDTFLEVAKDIPDETVDLIFADPPYDRESLPLYGDLGTVAQRVLKPGGSLICYFGQYALPEVIDHLKPYLTFYWTICCYHTGDFARMKLKGLIVKWKPMLWFVKYTRGDKLEFFEDLIESQQEKDAHDWQQSLVEARYCIEKLTPPNGLVFDPFCGGGTTAVAAKLAGRRWITCDVDKVAVTLARKRIHDAR